MAFKLSFPKPATAGVAEIAVAGPNTQARALPAGKSVNEPKVAKGGFVMPLVGKLPIEKQWPILATVAVLSSSALDHRCAWSRILRATPPA